MRYEFETIARRVEEVRERIAAACARAGRSAAEVKLVAVTKTHPVEAIQAAWQAGVRDFGENRVQEAVGKFSLLDAMIPDGKTRGLRRHLIGHLQTNKAKAAVEWFDLIHSVDSEKLASALERFAAVAQRPLPILIQVNVSGEATKSGVAPEQIERLLNHILDQCPHLVLEGFMTMAPLVADPEAARPHFRRLREIRDRLRERYRGPGRAIGEELSMGMTNDFEVAIEEGATLVRIGTALFGVR